MHTIPLIQFIAEELTLSVQSVKAVLELFEAGNTIPFIARYRKEATGNLDEVQIGSIQERYQYLQELESRKNVILLSIESQGKLTEQLRHKIESCSLKNALEDLYLPYKPKRRTKAAIAREKGLEPLAEAILNQSSHLMPDNYASQFVNQELGVFDSEAALQGARDIVAEKVSEEAAIRAALRERLFDEGMIVSKVRAESEKIETKFTQYYDFRERVRSIPSHRYLAIRRGESENVLDFSIEIDEAIAINQIISHMHVVEGPWKGQFEKAIGDSYRRLIFPSLETDVRVQLKLASDRAAVDVFATNLRHLLLAAPLGGKCVIGIDPGIRTGCKCVVVDETGKFLETLTIYPFQGDEKQRYSLQELAGLIKKYSPYAIGIGNGTAGRETEAFVKKVLQHSQAASVLVVSVNESGASIYSASQTAREEFPTLDLTIRGAISIARRLQDPLAELVKIDPKSIGVGQYQHDVNQSLLQEKLQQVVESCVNHVGVDLNTASASLLSYVSGIGEKLATKIVKHRDTYGRFRSRKELKKVNGFGDKTFEQAAGFLRIRNGDYPLDNTAVHPERYDFVEQIANDLDISIEQLLNKQDWIGKINEKKYVGSVVGEMTFHDIIQELKKPGRDPRAKFEPPIFRDDVTKIGDLKTGMILEGIVTNVTAFGAFVDIGVHQDGLVHLSELADKYIQHPSEVVCPGDKIKVEVLIVEAERKRIALSARIGKVRTLAVQPTQDAKSKPAKNSVFSANPFADLSL